MILTTVTYAQDQLADGISHSTSLFYTGMKEGVSCYRIPALVTATNGDLIAAIDERVPSCNDLRGSDDINIIIRRSSDNGKSWGEVETVIDFPIGRSASDPSMIVDEETDEIFLFYNYMDLEKEKDVYYLHLVTSKDHGNSWSQPRDITDQVSKPEWHSDFKFITSGRGIQTDNGTLLHTLVNLDNGLHVFGSTDHGSSWFLIDTPVRPANESKIIELYNGEWMINSRVNDQNIRFVHVSSDSGESWESNPSNLVDAKCNASIIRYDFKGEKALIFSNAHSTARRENLTIKISYDNGQSWSEGKTVYSGSSAYSTMTVMKDGNIGLLFEKDDYTDNTFVSIPFHWLKQ